MGHTYQGIWDAPGHGFYCNVCHKQVRIGRPGYYTGGEYGKDETALWYHLECALKMRPMPPGFAKYAKHARIDVAEKNQKPRGVAARNPKLEAQIIAHPGDRDALAVLADWLQAEGDPWGELMALAMAGKNTDRFFASHKKDFVGTVYDGDLIWRDGLIREFFSETNLPKSLVKTLGQLFELRTAFALERIFVPCITAEVVAALAKAPRGLRAISTRATEKNLALLAHPTVTCLELSGGTPDDAALARLLDGKRFPAVRRLDWDAYPGDALPASSLKVLLESKLLERLEVLALEKPVLDRAGSELLLANVDKLRHIPAVRLCVWSTVVVPLDKELRAQMKAYEKLPR
jgi:uncharacterized protein (TIGR02996 family)